jgi:hypothetical protein
MWLEAQTVSRFITIDPLAEKYYHISPYAYCANNPIRYIDPDGQSYGDFLDKKGRLIGNDGLDDGKIYVLKSTTDTKEATDFITKNSGDAKAFQGDNGKIAYNNSIEIEGSATARQAMVTEVSRDNGRGGTKDVNNREYGGSVLNGVVIPAEPGPVSNLQTDTKAEISLPIGVSTFHSHPSGT